MTFGSKSDKNQGSARLFSTRKRSKKDFSTGSLVINEVVLVLRSSKVVQISSRVATVGERSRKNMPKLLYARDPQNTLEEQKVRKLANSRHAPADWIGRARMIVLSWSGLRTRAIAANLGCHPQTVRERIHR